MKSPCLVAEFAGSMSIDGRVVIICVSVENGVATLDRWAGFDASRPLRHQSAIVRSSVSGALEAFRAWVGKNVGNSANHLYRLRRLALAHVDLTRPEADVYAIPAEPLRHNLTNIAVDAKCFLDSLFAGTGLPERTGIGKDGNPIGGVVLSETFAPVVSKFPAFDPNEELWCRDRFNRKQPYIPRLINGVYSHLRLRYYRQRGITCLWQSKPGTGKTSDAEAAHGDDLRVLSMHGDINVSDLVGRHTLGKDGDLRDVEGVLTECMRQGLPLLIDEAGRAASEVLAVLLEVIASGRLTLTYRDDEVVVAQPGFCMILCYNPDVPGSYLDPAVLSRMGFVSDFTSCWVTAAKLGVDAVLIAVAKALGKQFTAGSVSWCPEIRDALLVQELADIHPPDLWPALISKAPADARTSVAAEIKSQLISAGLSSSIPAGGFAAFTTY
jgi:AAA domain (dynein-related subfamily)